MAFTFVLKDALHSISAIIPIESTANDPPMENNTIGLPDAYAGAANKIPKNIIIGIRIRY